MVDNVIGTNGIGEALGMDQDVQQAFRDVEAAQALQEAQMLQMLQMLGQPQHGSHAPQLTPQPGGPGGGHSGAAWQPGQTVGPQPPIHTLLGKGTTKGGVKGPSKNQSKDSMKGLVKIGKPSGAAIRKQADAHKKQSPYARGLQNLNGAADFAKKVGAKVVAKGAAYHPSEHKPLAIPAHHGVHGILGIVHDSVLGVTHAALTPKQHAAVAAHNSAIARTHAAAMNSIKAGNRAIAAGKTAAATARKVKPVFDRMSGKTGGVHGILGFDYQLIGADANGLMPGQPGYDPTTDPSSPQYAGGAGGGGQGTGPDANGLMPGQPGYDPTTDPTSPQYAGGAGGGGGFTPDPTLYDPAHWGLPPLQPDYTDLDGNNPDPNLTPLPTGGGTLSKDDAMAPWNGPAPAAAVKWTGPIPDGAIGSANVFYGDGRGYFYGSSATGVDSSVWARHNALGWYLKKNTGPIQSGNTDYWGDSGGGDALQLDIDGANAASIRDGYGPIVGNNGSAGRGDQTLANAQYSAADKVFFWTIDNVPAAQLVQTNAALAEANTNTLKTDNAAIDAANAAITQQVAALAEAQIKQLAANALQHTADTGAEQHATSQATQASIASQEAQKEAQAKLDQQSQQEQLDEQARASQLEADMTRAQQQADAQQAQYDNQLAMAQQQADAQQAQYDNQLAMAQQQAQVQLAPIQAQADAQAQQVQLQMLQMLMQQGGFDPSQMPGFDPSQMSGFDPSQMSGFDPSQMQGFDPSQMSGFDPSQMQGFDPSQAIDPSQMPGFDPSQMQGFDPSQAIDPTQIPGYFDASMYYGG